MQFSVAAFVAFAGAALAQTPNFNPLTNPTMNEVIPAGKTYTIKWTPQGGNGAPVSLYAYAGKDAASLQEVGTIAIGIEASLARFDWNIEPSLGGKYQAYGIKIALASDKDVYQWSNPFTIAADPSFTSTSSSASSTASASSSGSLSAKTETNVSSTKLSTTMTAPTTSSTLVTSSSTLIGNLSTTASNTLSMATLTTTSTTRPTGVSGATSAVSPIATGAAVAKGASSIAVLGGLAMAVLAL